VFSMFFGVTSKCRFPTWHHQNFTTFIVYPYLTKPKLLLIKKSQHCQLFRDLGNRHFGCWHSNLFPQWSESMPM
jgi:hypothetical protein